MTGEAPESTSWDTAAKKYIQQPGDPIRPDVIADKIRRCDEGVREAMKVGRIDLASQFMVASAGLTTALATVHQTAMLAEAVTALAATISDEGKELREMLDQCFRETESAINRAGKR